MGSTALVGTVASYLSAAEQIQAAQVEDRVYEVVMAQLGSAGTFRGHSTKRTVAVIAGQEIGGEIGGWAGAAAGATVPVPGVNVATTIGGSVVGGILGDWIGGGAAGFAFDVSTRPSDSFLEAILNEPYFLQATDSDYEYWQGVLP